VQIVERNLYQLARLPVSTTAFTVTPAILPLGNALPAGATIRAGATPIAVAVSSSAPGVLTVTPTTVTFKPGDAQATVNARGVGADCARLSLSGPSAFQFGNAQSVVNVQVKWPRRSAGE
jgi:hypothetical protein